MPKINKIKPKKFNHREHGFGALIAVMILAVGTLAVSFVALSASVTYSDMTLKRELRVQSRLNAESCLETSSLMLAKDFFWQGMSMVSEFGCTVDVSNDLLGHVTIDVVTDLSGVKAWGKMVVNISGNSISVVSEEVL